MLDLFEAHGLAARFHIVWSLLPRELHLRLVDRAELLAQVPAVPTAAADGNPLAYEPHGSVCVGAVRGWWPLV